MAIFAVENFSFEALQRPDDGTPLHTAIFRGRPNSTWSLGLYRMAPSGPSIAFGTPTLMMDSGGLHRAPMLGSLPDGLYVARVEAARFPPSTPQIGDIKTAVPFWLGDTPPTDLGVAVDEGIEAQTAFRNREIRAPGFSGNNRLNLHILVEGCRLDYHQVIEGGFLSPLQHELGPSSLVDAVNGFLPKGAQFPITDSFRATYGQAHPLCLITFVNVQARNINEAVFAVGPRLHRVLAALAEDRSSTPEAVAYVSQDGSGMCELGAPSDFYRGNLIPGFGPGVTGMLDRFDRAIANDPWIEFALNLMRSIRLQTNPETQLFMAWSLIEAAAKRKVSSGKTEILDDDGNPVTGRFGKPMTQAADVGRVVIYLRDFVGRNLLGMHPGSGVDFFDKIKLAYQCRNQIAHGGGISAPGAQALPGYTPELSFSVLGWAAEVIRYECGMAAGPQ